jgi:hypothetical protein
MVTSASDKLGLDKGKIQERISKTTKLFLELVSKKTTNVASKAAVLNKL